MTAAPTAVGTVAVMNPLKFLAFGLAAMLTIGLGATHYLQRGIVDTAARMLVGTGSEELLATEYHDGTATTYDSAEERANVLRPQVHRVVAEHADDIEHILELRRTAPLPSADSSDPVSGLNLTTFERYNDLSCSLFAEQVRLPWLKDDMAKVCEEADVERAAYLRSYVYAVSTAHLKRRCQAAFGVFDRDYPKAERQAVVRGLDKGALAVSVPQEAADDDELTAEVKKLWDGLEADLDALVTKPTCEESFADLSEPLEYSGAGADTGAAGGARAGAVAAARADHPVMRKP